MTIVSGPAGTGKTRVGILLSILAVELLGEKVLYLASTNTAVDRALEELSK